MFGSSDFLVDFPHLAAAAVQETYSASCLRASTLDMSVRRSSWEVGKSMAVHGMTVFACAASNGCFLKWGYPQITHFKF